MNFAGLSAGEMWTLFAAFGGAMVVLYILKLRRRRVEVPFSPLWARVVEERQSSSLFRRLKRIFSLLVQLLIIGLLVLALGDPADLEVGHWLAGILADQCASPQSQDQERKQSPSEVRLQRRYESKGCVGLTHLIGLCLGIGLNDTRHERMAHHIDR